MSLRDTSAALLFSIMLLGLLAGCSWAGSQSQECRTSCSQQAVFHIVQMSSGSTSDSTSGSAPGCAFGNMPGNVSGVKLGLYDVAGTMLSEGVSDAQGMIALRAQGAVELRLGRIGQGERRIRLPQGLAELGGTLEFARSDGELVLHLPVTGGTGYSWQVAPVWGAIQKSTETVIAAPAQLPRPGSPAEQRLTIAAPSTGEALLFYARPWEKDVLPAAWRVILLEPK